MQFLLQETMSARLQKVSTTSDSCHTQNTTYFSSWTRVIHKIRKSVII